MKLYNWLKNEFKEFIFIFFFFLGFFLLINISESLLLKNIGISPIRTIQVVLAAFLIAKVVLLGSHLKILKVFDKKPLMVIILWKTFFYWISLFLIRLLIAIAPYLWKKEGVDLFFERLDFGFFFSIQSYYLMVLFIFETFHELTKKIGKQKMKELFFGKR
jgi:hypothetical protein